MSRKAWLVPRIAIIVGVVAVAGVIAAASPQGVRAKGAAVLFFDNMENGVNGWQAFSAVDTTGGPGTDCVPMEWHQVATDSHSATHSWTNGPYSAAGIDGGICLNYLISPPIVTPLGETNLSLTFWEHHHTEGPDPRFPADPCNPPENTPDCDFGLVQVSNDAGANWTDISPQIEGGLLNDPYGQRFLIIGPANFTPGQTIFIRFSFSADALVASPVFNGWFIDDVSVQFGPTAVDVASFSGRVSGRGVALTWSTGSKADALGYNVWRFAGAKGVKVNRTLVLAKRDVASATYRLLDSSARPGASYTYRLQAVAKDGKRAWRASTSVHVRN